MSGRRRALAVAVAAVAALALPVAASAHAMLVATVPSLLGSDPVARFTLTLSVKRKG